MSLKEGRALHPANSPVIPSQFTEKFWFMKFHYLNCFTYQLLGLFLFVHQNDDDHLFIVGLGFWGLLGSVGLQMTDQTNWHPKESLAYWTEDDGSCCSVGTSGRPVFFSHSNPDCLTCLGTFCELMNATFLCLALTAPTCCGLSLSESL